MHLVYSLIQLKTNFKMAFKKRAESATPPLTADAQTAMTQFPDGLMVFKPNARAPEWVLADVVVNLDKFATWVKENADKVETGEYGRQMRFSLKEGKNGKYYFAVNTFRKD